MKIQIVKKDGPDKFFYHKVEQTMEEKRTFVQGKLFLEAKYYMELVKYHEDVTEFFPNAKMGEKGGVLRGTGITKSTGPIVFTTINDDDFTSLARIGNYTLFSYLEQKDPKKYGGLKLHSAFCSLQEGVQQAVGIAFILEAGVPIVNLVKESLVQQRIKSLWLSGEFTTSTIAKFEVTSTTIVKMEFIKKI